jgi:hypothetical protein
MLLLAPAAAASGPTTRWEDPASVRAAAAALGDRRAGRALTARAARLAASAARHAGLLVHEQERPLVVMVAPLVQPDGLVLALADDSHHAARGDAAVGNAEGALRLRSAAAGAAVRARSGRRRRAAAARLTGLPCPGPPCPCPCPGPGPGPGLAGGSTLRTSAKRNGLPPLTGDRAARGDRQEVLAGDGIFEFPADVPPLDQHVDARRQRLGLHLVEPNRTNVLLPAEDELFFLLALRFVAPHRQRGGHQDRHHGQGDQQRGHRVTRGSAEACRTRTLTP